MSDKETTTENGRLQELQEMLHFKTQTQFAAALSITQGALSQIYARHKNVGVSGDIKRILENQYHVNIDWLETGKGEALLTSYNNRVQEPKPVYSQSGAPANIPVFPSTYIKEPSVNLWDYVSNKRGNINTIDLATFLPQLLHNCDVAHYVVSSDMSPVIERGDLLFLRHLSVNSDNVMSGGCYVIDTIHFGLIARIVTEKGNVFDCSVNNDGFRQMSLAKAEIYDVYQILLMVRTDFSIPYKSEQRLAGELDRKNEHINIILTEMTKQGVRMDAVISEMGKQGERMDVLLEMLHNKN